MKLKKSLIEMVIDVIIVLITYIHKAIPTRSYMVESTA